MDFPHDGPASTSPPDSDNDAASEESGRNSDPFPPQAMDSIPGGASEAESFYGRA